MHHKTKEMLRNALLAQLEELGGSAGNKALREAMEAWLERDVAQEDYDEVKEELVAEGVLGRGKGKGGSVFLAEDGGDEEESEDFALAVQEAPEPSESKPRKTKASAPRAPANQPSQVLAYRYDEKRKNNPHVGMVDVASDHEESETVWAYDPHIDPALQFDSQRAGIESLIDDALASGDAEQMRAALEELKRMQSPYLNWAGKAERTSFEVDTVSLHVHERIDPATILAAVQKRIKDSKGKPVGGFQPDLFHAPFENLPLSQAIDFYKHDRDWANRLIAGDSLLVMNSLLQKEGMAGQVQMIYIDPPYGISYGSNFQPFVAKRDVRDRKDEDLTQEPEMIKAFRDTWELGIHSYLTYLRDRLLLSRELLNESGSIFVQISDENVHLVRNLLDEVFGIENFCSQITFRKKTMPLGSDVTEAICDYLLWYSKNRTALKVRPLFKQKAALGDPSWGYVEEQSGFRTRITASEQRAGVSDDTKWMKLFQPISLLPAQYRPNQDYPIVYNGSVCSPPKESCWKTDKMDRIVKARRVWPSGNTLRYVLFHHDYPVAKLTHLWDDTIAASDMQYVVQTAETVISRCILMTTDPGDLAGRCKTPRSRTGHRLRDLVFHDFNPGIGFPIHF